MHAHWDHDLLTSSTSPSAPLIALHSMVGGRICPKPIVSFPLCALFQSMAPTKGEPTSTLSASQGGEGEAFISPKFQLVLPTHCPGSFVLAMHATPKHFIFPSPHHHPPASWDPFSTPQGASVPPSLFSSQVFFPPSLSTGFFFTPRVFNLALLFKQMHSLNTAIESPLCHWSPNSATSLPLSPIVPPHYPTSSRSRRV